MRTSRAPDHRGGRKRPLTIKRCFIACPGDINPLHADHFRAGLRLRQAHPARPVHLWPGCCRAVIRAFGSGDPRFFKSIKVRFADSVFPGETLVTEMWKESEGRIVLPCQSQSATGRDLKRRGRALQRGFPSQGQGRSTRRQTAAAVVSAEPNSADAFAGIRPTSMAIPIR